MHRPRLTAAACVVALLAALVVPLVGAPAAQAADGRDFDAGNIISDQVFFDSTTMSASQIQQFLDLKGASCVAGDQPCLKDYRTSTVAKSAEPGLCNGYAALDNQSAAQIIAGVASSCGVNPRVLVVLLEKEQSLVTGTKPTASRYQAATGYGCPDTAPCASQYYGLFNQLYLAARQYQNYAANPTRYGYQAGRTNTIAYNPNAACGSASVYIQNQATAGLYNYTPYVPDAAALANLYGTGDSCSSYGNRNFWRLFSDWFGSTQASSYLLRSPQDATVYLVTQTSKYPIASMDIVTALTPLGAVGFVSQQYLDRHTTGQQVGRALLGPDGTVWYFDAGIKLSFSSCAQVADFGQSCATAVPVDAGQIAALYNGGRMTNLFRTTSGKSFWIVSGTKREAADNDSLVAAGLPTAGVTLLESGIAYLPYGAPVVRDGTIVKSRATGALTLVDSGQSTNIGSTLVGTPGLSGLPVRPLDAASIAALAPASTLGTISRGTTDATPYLLTTTGKVAIDATAAPDTVPTVPDSVLARIPSAGTASSPPFVKTADNGTVYLLRHGQLRAIFAWSDLVQIAGTSTPSILTIAAGGNATLAPGPKQVAPGSLVVAPDNGTVYLIDGYDSRLTVGSFAVTQELGATRLAWLTPADIKGYTLEPGLITYTVQCGTKPYIGLSGHMYPLDTTSVAAFGVKAYSPLQQSTCDQLPVSTTPAPRFLLSPNGTIYFMDAGAKRPIASWGAYVGAGGTTANTLSVTDATLTWFPTGARL